MDIGYFVTTLPAKKPVDDMPIYNRAIAGTEVVAYYLAHNIIKRDCRATIFTTSIDSKDSVEIYDKIKIYRYAKSFVVGVTGVSFKLLYKPLKHEVDIVHAHAGNPPAPIAAYWYAKKEKKPFVVTYHGDMQWKSGGFIRKSSIYLYNKYLLDKILSYADVIISPSKYYIGESRVLGKYRDKIVVIPNGVNIEDFDIPYSKEECREKLGLPVDDEIILFLGTISPHKGPDVLLKAMPKILKNIPSTKLVFVGGGGMKGEFEGLSKKLGVEKNVRFVGFVEESLKPLYYKAANVFCLPSTMSTESFGIVNLEAMACGVPIVASKIGGIPDVVKDGENGLLAPPGDSEALADAIIYLLENENLRREMGNNGRKKVEDYSWERIAEETENVYNEVMNGYYGWR